MRYDHTERTTRGYFYSYLFNRVSNGLLWGDGMSADPIKAISKEMMAVQALKQSLCDLFKDDSDLLLDTIEGETSLFEAVELVLKSMDEDQIMLDGINERIDELSIRKARYKARIELKRAIMEQALAIAEQKTITLPVATITLSDRKQVCIIADEAAIPSDYWKRGDPKLDKAALKQALDDGKTIPGAHLDNGPQSITIRRK